MRALLERAFPVVPPLVVLPVLTVASLGAALLREDGLAAALLALPLLLTAQALRAGRLALLLRRHGLGLRAAVEAHAAGAAVSLLLPLKIGEAWRWMAIARGGPGLGPAFLALWAERLLDAALLVPLLAGALLLGAPAPAPLVAALALFLFASLLLLGAGPQEAPALARAVMARRAGAPATRAMALLVAAGRLLGSGREQIRGQGIPLAVLTLGLWTAEALAIGVLLDAHPLRLLLAPLAVSGGALSAHPDPVDRLADVLGPAAAAYLLSATLAAALLWTVGRLSQDPSR
jgi:hypothetical protein